MQFPQQPPSILPRLWNPLSKAQKLMGVFRGHVSPISHLMMDQKDYLLVSVSVSKDIRIFDTGTQLCIQKIHKASFKALGKKPFTAACINKKNHTVVMSSNMRLALIEGKEDSMARHSLTTLPCSITAALYNPLFKHLVTGDWKSQVIVWNAATGDKMVHYSAHSVVQKGRKIEIEIKVMAFDSTFRRLITGHRDGMVKVWNYNVGVLLQELPVPERFEVSALCCSPMKIFVAGCNKSVFMHISGMGGKDYVTLQPSHPDSITTLAVFPDHYLASASLDGTLIIYNLKTNLPRLKFNLTNPHAPASVDFYGNVTIESIISYSPYQTSERAKSKKMMKYFAAFTKKTSNKKVTRADLHYKYCVESMVFLGTRKITPHTAVLLTGMHDGRVLAWPISIKGACLGEFMAVYKESELLHAAAVTSDNVFLVTGDSLGYLKVWDISHYLNPEMGRCNEKLDESRMNVWKQFAFVEMRQNIRTFVSSCNRSTLPAHMNVKCDQLGDYPVESPHLINSFKAHVGDIVDIKLVEMSNKHMIISTASDMSVRIWSITGSFLGILGQKSGWNSLENVFGFLSKKVRKEIEASNLTKEVDDCGLSSFHMSKDEVKLISYKESMEDLTARPVRLEKRVSKSGSATSIDKMFEYLDNTVIKDTFIENVDMESAKNSTLVASSEESLHNPSESFSYDEKYKTMKSVTNVFYDLWDNNRKRPASKHGIPSDLKRVGSFTTLFVLESELGIKGLSKWSKIKHATVWIVHYLQPKTSKLFHKFTLPNGDASKVGVYSNNIKDMIEEYMSYRATHTIAKSQRNETTFKEDKKNILVKPLSPLKSEIFGQFYSEPYTQHRPIKPISLAHEVAMKEFSSYKKLPLAVLSDENPAKLVAQLFYQAGYHNVVTSKSICSHHSGQSGFVPNTESEMTLVRNLNKTGWKLMSDGTLARRKVPLNSGKTHSYLPPLLVPENSVQDGVKKKGENCYADKTKSRNY